MSSLNIEACRQHWESDEQWELRKEFLETYKDNFDDAKLLCLAQVYTNMELLGCSYPAPVALQVRDLAKDLKFGRELQQTRKARQAVQFIKAGNSSNSAKRVGYPSYLSEHKKVKFKDSSSKTQEITSETIAPSISQQLSMPIINKNPGSNTNKSASLESKIIKTISSSSQRPSPIDAILLEKLQKLKLLSANIRKAILYNNNAEFKCLMALHNVCQKLGYPIAYVTEYSKDINKRFTMTVKVLDVILSKITGPSKKQLKAPLSKQAVDLLFNPAVKVVCDGKDFILKEGNEEVNVKVKTQQPALNLSSSLPVTNPPFKNCQQLGVIPLSSQIQPPVTNPSIEICQQPEVLPLSPLMKQYFIILDKSDINNDLTPIVILRQSSQFCKIPINFEFSINDSVLSSALCNICEVSLGGELVCRVSGPTKQETKNLAARLILDSLSKVLYTIKVIHDTDEFVVPRDQLFENPDLETSSSEPSTTETSSSEISTTMEYSIGCKILKMMGWSGGGIGKEGNIGISEPIKAEGTTQRCGLGYSGGGKKKIKCSDKKYPIAPIQGKIESLLYEYARSSSLTDLVFAPDFSIGERKHIHRIAHKHHLKSWSRGAGETRYLTLSRQVTSQELLSILKAAGGSAGKYVLISPQH